MWIICYLADNSQEISSLIFSEKKKIKMLSAIVVIGTSSVITVLKIKLFLK